ncbi:MAG: hypothetical protein SAMD01599839_06680 [Rectinema sp.]
MKKAVQFGAGNIGRGFIGQLFSRSGYEVAPGIVTAMEESARAIATEHGVGLAPLLEYVEYLIGRFANRKLGDTIERVGRDLPRKLAPRDRLAGAVALCAKHGLPRNHILEALVAALFFDDRASSVVKDRIEAEGPRAVLESICCLVHMVDGATGRTFSFFCEEETTSDAMRLLWRWIECYGIPQVLYCDKKNAFMLTREPL